MTALRKRRDGAATQIACTLPPEAFDYDADVTTETVKIIQEQADRFIQTEEWEVVEGYVGNKR